MKMNFDMKGGAGIPRLWCVRLLVFILLFGSRAALGLELCPLFSNHAVLQRDMPVRVWGWGEAGSKVSVEFAGQKVEAVADDSGKWQVTLQPLALSKQPQQLVVTAGGEKITRNGILVGDVWLCSGQSNMEMTFQTPRLPCDMPDFVKPGDYPQIRHLAVQLPRTKKGEEPVPGQITGNWAICDAESCKGFSATAFFFAFHLAQEVDVPIGLLNSTQGNSRIDSWISERHAGTISEQVPTGSLYATYKKPPFTLYNSKIKPIAGYAIRGALWYQGEGNGKEGMEYYWKLKALIEGWRKDWGQGDFPFYFVQLPSYNGKLSWAPIREAQRQVHMTVPNTGMVVLTDSGDNDQEFPINLHPRNKFVVGQRLAQWALAKDYGKAGVVPSGPLFKAVDFNDGKAIVSFDHVGSGLMAAKKESSRSVEGPQPVAEVIGFEIAGKDGNWVAAKAVIDGDKVMVSSDAVGEPVAVRYLQAMNTDHGTLYNKEGLPASPFSDQPRGRGAIGRIAR